MSFLNDYLLYTSSLECPDLFQQWCAFSALSAAAQRKVWIDMGLFKVSPNLYTILVAPPGKCGKSTAMNVVKELLSFIEAIRVDTGSTTMEALLVTLEGTYQRFEFPNDKTRVWGHSSLTFFANEMSVFIKQHNKDFVSHLNDLFDCKAMHKHTTKHSGSNTIVNPYLNILGCTTPKWISENVHEDVIEGGLTARTILAFSDKPKKPNPFPELTPEAMSAKNRMLTRLQQISSVGGEFRFDPEAREYYARWYIDHKQRQAPSYQLEGFWNRKHVHLMKLAMLVSLAQIDALVITTDHLKEALRILDLTEPSIETSLKGVGRNELHPIAEEMFTVIHRYGVVELKVLYDMFAWQCRDQEFEEIILSLTKAGKVVCKLDNGKNLIMPRPVPTDQPQTSP